MAGKVPGIGLAAAMAVWMAACGGSGGGIDEARAAAAAAPVDSCVSAPPDGYGGPGPYTVAVQSVANPERRGADVTVFSPQDAGSAPRPVIFFAHAFAAGELDTYIELLERLASQGWIVVHSPYGFLESFQLLSPGKVPPAYDQLWAGFEAAVTRYGDELHMDTSRIGFIGHSFGGGASPAMLTRALARGWGGNARFVFIMAPFRVYEITPDDYARWPSDTRALIEVYDDDDTNDHRYAIDDIWAHLGTIPDARKDYLLLGSATHGSCTLPADHAVPMARNGRYGQLNGFDPWAVWRRADALARCTFDGDANGCAIALGRGDARQADMGNWLDDGSPLPPIQSLIPPQPRNCGEGERCTFRRD